MYLPDFDYYAPETVEEASALLREHLPHARVLAGGTDVLVKMKHGLMEPKVLVSLKNLHELRGVRYEPGRGVVIGALTTPNELIDSPVLHEHFKSVSGAAHTMAAMQIRHTGTIGGNIVNAVPSADLPPILMALEATMTLVSTQGSRTMPVFDFFLGPCITVIEPDEILTEIVIPEQPTTGSTYYKFKLRRSGALAVVGVAAAVTMDDGVVRSPRICLGAVSPRPVRAFHAEGLIDGTIPDEELLEKVGLEAASESCCMPINDLRGSEEYRRDMVRVFTKRALRRAMSEGHV